MPPLVGLHIRVMSTMPGHREQHTIRQHTPLSARNNPVDDRNQEVAGCGYVVL